MTMTRRELQAMCRTGGLTVEGNESIAELSEALTFLAQVWKEMSRRMRQPTAGIIPWTSREMKALDESGLVLVSYQGGEGRK